MKMYLISDNKDTQMGMRLAGIEGCVVHETDEVTAELKRVISDENIGIVLITEKLVKIVPDYITGYIYGALVESFCAEHNSRMLAMQQATDSAGDMIRELSIAYNRARQAAITQEITEVVSGTRNRKKAEH